MFGNKLLTRQERKALEGGWYQYYTYISDDGFSLDPLEITTQGVLKSIKSNPFTRRLHLIDASRHELWICHTEGFCGHTGHGQWQQRRPGSLIEPSWDVLEREDLVDGGIRLKHRSTSIYILLYPASPQPPWPPAIYTE